jgi:hypothetical protein
MIYRGLACALAVLAGSEGCRESSRPSTPEATREAPARKPTSEAKQCTRDADCDGGLCACEAYECSLDPRAFSPHAGRTEKTCISNELRELLAWPTRRDGGWLVEGSFYGTFDEAMSASSDVRERRERPRR